MGDCPNRDQAVKLLFMMNELKLAEWCRTGCYSGEYLFYDVQMNELFGNDVIGKGVFQ